MMSIFIIYELFFEHVYMLAAILITLLFIRRLYAVLTLGVCTSNKNMTGMTVIVTGANSGIGKETSKNLAIRGARVIMACRNIQAANTVRDEIVSAANNRNVIVSHLDLSSFASIRDFAATINKTESRLDVLIHNAGMAGSIFPHKKTVDGLEMVLGTNHYGVFLLTHLLIDLLKKSSPSRIVVVASRHYCLASLNLNNPNPTYLPPCYLYFVSKYANIVFTKELARRLKGTGVTANCLHPGVIDTGIWRYIPFPLSVLYKGVIFLFYKTAEQGAQTTIHVAVSEEVEGVTGKYFRDCKENAVTRGADDPTVAKKWWEISETLVKLLPSDPHI